MVRAGIENVVDVPGKVGAFSYELNCKTSTEIEDLLEITTFNWALKNALIPDIEYVLEERPSDQLELSAGYGGASGLIGTLGVTFNNFSVRNLKNRETPN